MPSSQSISLLSNVKSPVQLRRPDLKLHPNPKFSLTQPILRVPSCARRIPLFPLNTAPHRPISPKSPSIDALRRRNALPKQLAELGASVNGRQWTKQCWNKTQTRELCYICSQRAARNVPVYVRKQEEEAERKNAQILQMAQQRKAEEAIQKEFELRQEQRRQNREVAAFNQGTCLLLYPSEHDLELCEGAAVAVKEKRLDEAKSHLPHVSILLVQLTKLVHTLNMATKLYHNNDNLRDRTCSKIGHLHRTNQLRSKKSKLIWATKWRLARRPRRKLTRTSDWLSVCIKYNWPKSKRLPLI